VKTAELDYYLPHELIAQQPLEDRSASRLLLVSRRAGDLQDRSFCELPALLGPTDFLVMNNSRVFPARLLGQRETGGKVELLLLRPLTPGTDQSAGSEDSSAQLAGGRPSCNHMTWEVLARPKRKLRAQTWLFFSPELQGRVVSEGSGEKALIDFEFQGDFYQTLERSGRVPLPPYIDRPDSDMDRERYQTVYAEQRGSVAAPTAGLHFTQRMLDQLHARGVDRFMVTLHVGYGTFRPVKTDDLENHHVDREPFEITWEAAAGIRRALAAGRRLIAVGTTTTRVLEHWKRQSLKLEPFSGETDLFIYPPFDFEMVQGLLTNFHLPRSSLFALICALLGTDLAHVCYRHAVEKRYRFYSYGDCMLIV
jgi:S-adenosylmethionine:tRNA ribosyltransferase-isomerase